MSGKESIYPEGENPLDMDEFAAPPPSSESERKESSPASGPACTPLGFYDRYNPGDYVPESSKKKESDSQGAPQRPSPRDIFVAGPGMRTREELETEGWRQQPNPYPLISGDAIRDSIAKTVADAVEEMILTEGVLEGLENSWKVKRGQ